MLAYASMTVAVWLRPVSSFRTRAAQVIENPFEAFNVNLDSGVRQNDGVHVIPDPRQRK
jgi:hypothetical protein